MLTIVQVSFLLGFAPAGIHKLTQSDDEIATSRAAAKNSIAMGLSAWSTCPMEDVIAEKKENLYAFQVTLPKDQSIALKMLKGAKSIFSSILKRCLEIADD